jgi:hypothetical protein
MFDTIIELIKYIVKSKKYWVIPVIIALLILGSLIILTQGSIISPFIYTII